MKIKTYTPYILDNKPVNLQHGVYLGGSISGCCGSECASTLEEFEEAWFASICVYVGDKATTAKEQKEIEPGVWLNIKYTQYNQPRTNYISTYYV